MSRKCRQHNKPIELWSNKVIEQKIYYIQNNSIEAGFVVEPYYWKYSSAANFSGELSIMEIDEI